MNDNFLYHVNPSEQAVLDCLQTLAADRQPVVSDHESLEAVLDDDKALSEVLQNLKVQGHLEFVGSDNASEDALLIMLRSSWVRLPIIGQVAAGVPIEAIENQSGQLLLPLEAFEQPPTYLLKVRGDSMKDVGIQDGDLIAVRKTGQSRDGRIVVARVDNEVTVKRLRICGDKVVLAPENEHYKPLELSPEDLLIEGEFVGMIRGSQGPAVLH